MLEKKKLENIIHETQSERDKRNKELMEYSRRHYEEIESKRGDKKGTILVNTLTQLPGLRVFFYEMGEIIMAHPELFFGVIVMDISQFKAVNEFCGRKAGDDLLQFISAAFQKVEFNRNYTKAGHARADIFILCTYFESEQELIDIAEGLYKEITTYQLPYKVSPYFGICPSYESVPAVSFLKDCATLAVNEIKGTFYSWYSVFDEAMRQAVLREKQVENDIINAINKSELKAYVQPKVDMRTGLVVGGESLVRWHHSELKIIPPDQFIPVLEKNGFIIQLDYYVWELVAKFIGDRKKAGKKIYPISINISRAHAHDIELCEKLIGLVEKYDIDPKYLPLEITESAFEANAGIMLDNMGYLRKKGFLISIDDFGTGYSSLQMISGYDVDEVKIDRGFILDLNNRKSAIVLENIIKMIKELNISFIVEGVETAEQKLALLNYGCNHVQGFYFYRPMPMEEFEELISRQDNNCKK